MHLQFLHIAPHIPTIQSDGHSDLHLSCVTKVKMPKGQKIVDWTKPENDQKLLLAIIKVSEVSKKYQEIAAAFGRPYPVALCQVAFGWKSFYC